MPANWIVRLAVAATLVSSLSSAQTQAKSPDGLRIARPLLAAATPLTPEMTADQKAIQELRELGQVVHHLHQASNDLASEVSQPVEMMGEIDMIGGQVIPIMPATAEGFGPTQYLPPRKKYLNLYMAHIANLLPLLNDEINTLVVPSAAAATVSPMVAQLKQWSADIQQNYTTLQGLTAGPSYVNQDIRSQAMAMTDAVKAIEKVRRDIYRATRNDEKTAR